MKQFISIDFGTSSSAVALIKRGKPVLAPPLMADAAGSQISPTTAYVDNEGQIHVCHMAELKKTENLSRYLKEFKLDMHLGERSSVHAPFVDIVRAILENLKESAQQALGAAEPVKQLLLTIPAIYQNIGDQRKELMLRAAQAAGFEEIELLNESEAAAIYFDYLQDTPLQSISLIYDLGGGTFDPSLIEHRDDEYHLLGNGTGIDVGGKFFTSKIIRQYTKHIQYTPSADIQEMYAEKNKIVELCESLKRQLSTLSTANTPDGFLITRDEFESHIALDVKRTLESCTKLIEDCGKSWEDINQILLIGGSCAVPYVRQAIADYSQSHNSPAKIIWRNEFKDNAQFDPQFAVALGGALYAKKKFAPKPSIGYVQFFEGGLCKNVPLHEGLVTIGRWSQNSELSIPISPSTQQERKMSRRHCQIEVNFNERKNKYYYILTDAGSANGTYVNGEKLRYGDKQELKMGDRIIIGQHTLELFC